MPGRNVSARATGWVVCAAALLASSSTFAETPPAPASPLGRVHPTTPRERRGYVFSSRAAVGLGRGSLGLGGRFGLAAEYWLTDELGVGAVAAATGQGGLVDGPQSSAWLGGPVAALRSNRDGGYFFGTLGAGFAAVKRWEAAPWCLGFGGGGCPPPPPPPLHYVGWSVDTALGWLGHPWGSAFEIGPVLRLNAESGHGAKVPAAYLVTLNVELGFALFVRR